MLEVTDKLLEWDREGAGLGCAVLAAREGGGLGGGGGDIQTLPFTVCDGLLHKDQSQSQQEILVN